MRPRNGSRPCSARLSGNQNAVYNAGVGGKQSYLDQLQQHVCAGKPLSEFLSSCDRHHHRPSAEEYSRYPHLCRKYERTIEYRGKKPLWKEIPACPPTRPTPPAAKP